LAAKDGRIFVERMTSIFRLLAYIPDLPQVIWKVQQIIERRILDCDPAPVYKGALRQSRFQALEPLQAEVQHINIMLFCQCVEDEVEPLGTGCLIQSVVGITSILIYLSSRQRFCSLLL